ncbi:pleckstrin homology domain-containing family O member 1-A [Astyanax mexicanus]|uniref:Pleckstrin homology domain-containing family O member 1-A-like n=3 Tax=Astyanax mexicanus TaxID=7994 RepID=A0A8T2M633_ASTMX|nr:pleckstrin homology domain-containing family O member 1-A [Astyanax mexicanus]KAG9279823.1 pleckstrin homology domain-containing family O member 1-A-like [Astyanax mexicanus]
MKKSHLLKRGLQDANQLSSQPDKVGWIRKFCGKGIFREIWRNRFVMLKGDHLYIFEKEMKNDGKTHEVFDLAEYERSEEVRKAKSHSKKNLSKFSLLRCRQSAARTPNLVFLAVSPEEKESWINVLNTAIIRAKNRILDEVMIEEESLLAHPTRDRVKIPLGRRLPTRGHLMAVASTSSDGMLTLDLVHEEDASMLDEDYAVWVKDHRGNLDVLAPGRKRAGTDVSRPRVTPVEAKVKTSSLPRGSELSWSQQSQTHTPQPGKKLFAQGRSRCGSMDDALSRGERRPTKRDDLSRQAVLSQSPTSHLQDLINQRLQRTQELLAKVQEQEPIRGRMGSYTHLRGVDSPRLRHLKGSESPHSKSSSSHSSTHGKSVDSSPQLKTKDSPSSKHKDSPRVKAKDSPSSKSSKSSHSKANFRSKSIDSPDSKSSSSPHMKHCIDLTHIKSTDSPLSAGSSSPHLKGVDSPSLWLSSSPHFKGPKGTDSPLGDMLDWESRRTAAERLLQEALSAWEEAREVLAEVRELQARQQQAENSKTAAPSTPSKDDKLESL